MNRLKAWVRAFFGLSRKETNAFLILLPLMVMSVFLVPTYHYWQAQQPRDFSAEVKKLDSVLATWKWQDSIPPVAPPHQVELFTFDPNTTPVPQLVTLGFPDYLANRIHNYRAKKGRFIVKSDLLKIYGMDTSLYQQLKPYINLPEVLDQVDYLKPITEPKSATPEKFDLNAADTTQLIRIYGIGSKLSTRIIKYRNQLGGFISMNQLYEVYGLDSATVKELEESCFIVPDYQPRLLDLNLANEKELAQHPYIRYNLAKAIATYRFQHGKFQSLEELKKIALVDEAFYNRIKPYLTINP